MAAFLPAYLPVSRTTTFPGCTIRRRMSGLYQKHTWAVPHKDRVECRQTTSCKVHFGRTEQASRHRSRLRRPTFRNLTMFAGAQCLCALAGQKGFAQAQQAAESVVRTPCLLLACRLHTRTHGHAYAGRAVISHITADHSGYITIMAMTNDSTVPRGIEHVGYVGLGEFTSSLFALSHQSPCAPSPKAKLAAGNMGLPMAQRIDKRHQLVSFRNSSLSLDTAMWLIRPLRMQFVYTRRSEQAQRLCGSRALKCATAKATLKELLLACKANCHSVLAPVTCRLLVIRCPLTSLSLVCRWCSFACEMTRLRCK